MSAAPTKADEIATVLEEAILSGELSPGRVLRQEELSEEFGVSRTPIREALQQLAALGLVSFSGKRGVRVRPLQPEELIGSFTVRAALEGYAAQLARTNLTEDELRQLQAAHEKFAAATEALREADERERIPLAAEWVRANSEFHDVYLNGCGVPKLAEAAKNARVYTGQPAWSHSAELDEQFALNVEQHREIAEAFAARSTKVRRLVQEHILSSAELLQRSLEQANGASSGLASRVSWAAGPQQR
jgi:DNA-binding GntR family transcriptional regulator